MDKWPFFLKADSLHTEIDLAILSWDIDRCFSQV